MDYDYLNISQKLIDKVKPAIDSIAVEEASKRSIAAGALLAWLKSLLDNYDTL